MSLLLLSSSLCPSGWMFWSVVSKHFSHYQCWSSWWLHNGSLERSHSRVSCVRVHQQLTHSYYAARAVAGVLAWPGDTQHPNTVLGEDLTPKTFSLILLTSHKQLHQRQQQPCEKFQIFLLLMIIFRKALYKTLIKYFSLDVTLSFSLLGSYNTIQRSHHPHHHRASRNKTVPRGEESLYWDQSPGARLGPGLMNTTGRDPVMQSQNNITQCPVPPLWWAANLAAVSAAYTSNH